jgi:hypothetical protein
MARQISLTATPVANQPVHGDEDFEANAMGKKQGWFNRGGRNSRENLESIDNQPQGAFEPLRSMTIGEASSLSGSRNDSDGSGRRRSSGFWRRRPSGGWDEQSSVDLSQDQSVRVQSPRRSVVAAVGAAGRWSPRLLFAAVGFVVVVAVAAAFSLVGNRHNSGNNTADPPPRAPAAPPAAPATGSQGGGGFVPPSQLATPPADGTPSADPSAPPGSDAPSPPPPGNANPNPANNNRVSLNTLRPRVVPDEVSGKKVSASLGAHFFPDSTTASVGCFAKPATLVYQLDGQFSRMVAVLGLTGDDTPGDLVAVMSIAGDGKVREAATVSLDRQAHITLNLSGVRSLAVSTQRVRGTCRDSQQPYGLLGSATLTRK